MNVGVDRSPVLLVALSGCLLSAYTVAVAAAKPMGAFHVGLFVWTRLPYALALLLTRLRLTRPGLALGYAAGALADDLFMHYPVFIAPKGSTAALGTSWESHARATSGCACCPAR
jgi:hypothetical protein